MRAKNRGFTLIEVMIVVVVVAILAAVALPSYQSSVRKARRVDAHGLLQAAQLAQEKYRLNNTTYALTANFTDPAFARVCVNVGGECRSQEQNYVLTATAATGTDFTLTATARGAQAQDTTCATITVTQAVTGTPASTVIQYLPPACWVR
jgi:type IV pilus assembly protein PilE